MNSDNEIEERLIERLVRYAIISSASCKESASTPTTDGQWELARLLIDELHAIGVKDVELSEHCYVIARVPSNCEGDVPVIGFLAHLDTSNDTKCENIKPIVEHYNGGVIKLTDGAELNPQNEDGLDRQSGGRIVRTDGSTLLGADDKAGIAEIITAIEYLLLNPELRRPSIEIIFTPDEETGKGLPCLPLEKIHAQCCYTLDGGAEAEIEAECFNAYSANLVFHGNVMHPGSARGKLVNAAVMAAYFISLIPRSESPESTDGYYGYYCVIGISGSEEKTALELIIRDFERAGMERRLAALKVFAEATEAAFPGGSVRLETKQSYLNMKEKIDSSPEVMEKLISASRSLGIEPKLKPIRGGTDGARLTELGIPTPNIWTGGRNFHSRKEWASVREMRSAAMLIVALAGLWA